MGRGLSSSAMTLEIDRVTKRFGRTVALDRLAFSVPEGRIFGFLGANAIVSMRFDTSELGGTMSEIVAYGTAVMVEPDPTATTPTTPVE